MQKHPALLMSPSIHESFGKCAFVGSGYEAREGAPYYKGDKALERQKKNASHLEARGRTMNTSRELTCLLMLFMTAVEADLVRFLNNLLISNLTC